MHEATILSFVAFCYAALISFGSMGVSIVFARYDLLLVGHIIVLVIFVAGGFGFMAWAKQRLANPLVNVATSLASLGCITILIREGSVQAGAFSTRRVTQVLGMVILGMLIASLVNFLILPTLARKKLSKEIELNTDLLAEKLISITRAFLNGREADLENDYYKKLNKEHASSLEAVKKNLIEAKREHYVLGDERIYRVEKKLVQCLATLGQDLGGLRSAARAQFAFINQPHPCDEDATPLADQTLGPLMPSPSALTDSEPSHYFSSLDVISEAPEEPLIATNGRGVSPDRPHRVQSAPRKLDRMGFASPTGCETPYSMLSATEPSTPEARDNAGGSNIAKSPQDMFVAFISQLGPPTKSLVYTLKQVLDELPFQSGRRSRNPWVARDVQVAVTERFHTSLEQAVELYRRSRKEALSALYQNRAINAAINARYGTKNAPDSTASSVSNLGSPEEGRYQLKHSRTLFDRQPDEVLADIEEVSACCGHFSFSLLDFAEDVLTYLDVLDDLKSEMDAPVKSWNWLAFWKKRPKNLGPSLKRHNTFPERTEDAVDRYDIPSPIRKADNFADPEKAHTNSKPWYYTIYKASRILRRDDVRFAIKVGFGAALYALPAFLEETRPFFLHWRGEWGLVSYMVVCCMTVGASNTTVGAMSSACFSKKLTKRQGFNRIFGTLIGACCAVVAWLISNDDGVANPYLLAFFGWLMSLGW